MMLCRPVYCLLASMLAAFAGPITREANTTLRLPSTIYGGTFGTEEAFPGLTFPAVVGIVQAPGDVRRLFFVEQRGRIQVISNLANPAKGLFLDLTAKTNFEGESGLLGLAFHPNFRTNRYFYVFYSARPGQRVQRISRFEVSAENPNLADPQSEQVLIEQVDEASNHNGGDLAFGPDGYLYISLGDEGAANDSFNNGRFVDKDFFAGILRIDVDKRPGSLPPNDHPSVRKETYAIPPDNPYVGITSFLGRSVIPSQVRTEFWATGLRNPWRMSFDSATGRLIVGDVGQNAWEEIDIIEKGGHYGWSHREGKQRFTSGPGGSREPEGFAPLPPVWDYGRSQGASVTGGYVYRGARLPDLFSHYIFGDYVSGRVWAMSFQGSGAQVRQILQEPGSNISAFGIDPSNGDLLIARVSQGRVFRVVRTTPLSSLMIPSKLSETGAFSDLSTLQSQPGLVAYEPQVSFWSDHALKRRWFSLPDIGQTIGFSAEGAWSFPAGSLWVKHFDMEMRPGDAASRRRLETRFLVKTTDGSYGLSYRWNEAQTDAELVEEMGAEQILAIEENGQTHPRTWRFPSRSECLACHTPAAGHALSFQTRQLNRLHDFGGVMENQLKALNEAGYFTSFPASLDSLPVHADLGNPAASLESRVRSYLAVNCAQCHQPGGPGLGSFDVRPEISLADTKLINGETVSAAAIPGLRLISPGSEANSMLLKRLLGDGFQRMPPIATNEIDSAAVSLLRAWIAELGKPTTGYEAWASKNFGSSDPEARRKEADPDGDNRSNYLEFLTGTDPRKASDFWNANLRSPRLTEWELEFTQPAKVVTLIETSKDLSLWSPWAHEEVPKQPVDAPTPRRLLFNADAEANRYFRFRFEELEGK